MLLRRKIFPLTYNKRMSFPESYNTFQIQAASYLGITGGTIASLQPLITYTSYTPSTSSPVNCTIDGATGTYDNLGTAYGYITITTAGVTGKFTFQLPSGVYTNPPAVVLGVSGNDTVANQFVISADESTSTTVVASWVKVEGITESTIRISWIAMSV